MDRETWIDIAKACGFVLAGTLGVVALVAFAQGFRDGYSESGQRADAPAAERSADAETSDADD